MTYNYRYWTAFREADLLKAGDHSIGSGDSFVMPGASTVKLAAYDNDGQLSGDNAYDQATDSDGHYDQYGWVNDGSGWVQTGDLYVEKTFTLKGSDGKTYVLAEIEGEGHDAAGEGDDYFSFVGAVPPAGVTLTVVSGSDSHGVNYADLSADPSEAPANTAPVFDNLPADGIIMLDENIKHVIDVNASDADGDTLTYSISGADADSFTIDAQTGVLKFIENPDFENPTDGNGDVNNVHNANNVYDVTVTVTDGNGGSATKTMWVKIQDVDEHVNTAPVFDNLPADGIIMLDENIKHVIDVNASDADGDTLTYSISGADADSFTIDAHTGVLKFIETPDFENPTDGNGDVNNVHNANNVYDVTVTVTDGNGGSATKTMWVKIQDVDEHVNTAPIFDNLPANGVLHVNENGTMVIDIDASDADGDTLTYAITGGADAADFSIDPTTGKLTFNTAPDFENPHDGNTDNTYDVTVTVTDGNGGTTTKPLWIKVDDVDETVNTAPTFDNTPANGVIMLDENNTMVLDIDASDLDGDTLTYAITGGADAADFSIDPATGKLTFNENPDFENPHDGNSDNTYDVTVTVTDGNGGSATKPLWVKVQDAAETGRIEGRFTRDADSNDNEFNDDTGTWDAGISGALVKLYDTDGNFVTQSTTDANGNYSFDVPAGDYQVKFPSVLRTEFSEQNSGAPEHMDSDADANGLTEVIHLNVGAVVGNIDAGVKPINTDFRVCDDPDAVNIDFEGLASGTVLNAQYDGVMISAQKSGDGSSGSTSPNDAMVFDSSNPTGGDHDLATDSQGNILIVSEDNDSTDPDDNAGGGTIWFKFDEPSYIYDIKVVDAEEGGKIRLLDDNGQLIKEVTIPGGTDGGIQQVLLDVEGVAQIDLTLNGSGAIDDLCYVPGEAAPVLGSISGVMFMDNNDNSIEDDGDMRVEGETVELYQHFGSNNPTDELIVNGDFEDLSGGTGPNNTPAGWVKDGHASGVFSSGARVDGYGYALGGWSGETGQTLEQTVQTEIGSGYTLSFEAGALYGSLGDATLTVLVNGKEVLSLTQDDLRATDDAYDVTFAAISNQSTVTFLFDGDGAESGDIDLDNISLKQANGWQVVQTQETDANGGYHFEDLVADPNYYVRFFNSDDSKSFVDANVGGDDTVDSDGVQNAGGGIQVRVPLGEGENITDVDQGVETVDAGTASIAGTYFMDNNDNDVQDAGDMGLAGQTVWLLDAGRNAIEETTTDANGNYIFEGLDAGDYFVRFDGNNVDGKTLVESNVGNDDTIDSDIHHTGTLGNHNTDMISLGAGENITDVDAGVEDPGTASIAGTYFMDNNDNDVQDAGDMGLAGQTVWLVQNTVIVGETTTDADGNYIFEGLEAGNYLVRFDGNNVDGKTLVESNVGNDDTIDSDADRTGGFGNHNTAVISLGIGETVTDVDAGVEDPGTASIGDKVFLDANGNGQQDAGEQGVDGVQVTLFNAAGVAVSTITTSNGGMYLFDNLDAGDYSVGFEAPDGFDLTDANVGNDASDSDADQGTGRTGTINLEIGEDDRSVDAGLVEQNTAPNANDDDAGKACADKDITVDVLANDTDADGDALSVTAVNGQAIAEGQTIDVDGVDVSLVGGSLVFNGEAAYADLNVGEEASVTYTYTVSDGNGGTGTANVEVGYCGVAETIQDICDSLPSSINYQIVDEYENGNDGAFTLKIDGSGDARLDGLVIEAGYCVSAFDPALGGSTFVDAPIYSADLYCTDDDAAIADVLAGQTGINGQSAADNMDLVNWILNQEFSENGYTDAEVQGAIWSLTDSIDFVRPEYGDLADVQEIVALATANGEGFEAGPGGVVGLLVDPNPATDTNSQPFILAVDFDSMDCLC